MDRGGEVEKMENELTKDEHAWLVEYQACQQESDSNSSNFWTLASIFIGFSSALLGVLLYGMLANIDTITKIIGGDAWTLGIIITVVGLGMVSILIFLWFWLKRTQYLMDRNYERMREIELELKMQKSWRVNILDKWRELKLQKPYTLYEKNIDDIWNKLLPKLRERLPEKYYAKLDERKNEFVQLCIITPIQHCYERPSRYWNIKFILGILIGLWVFLIGMALFIII
jgi:hypothetical protein